MELSLLHCFAPNILFWIMWRGRIANESPVGYNTWSLTLKSATPTMKKLNAMGFVAPENSQLECSYFDMIIHTTTGLQRIDMSIIFI